MPGRQLTARRGPSESTSTNKPRAQNKRKQQKRFLNAYTEAQHSVPEKTGLRRSRAGVLETADGDRKRGRSTGGNEAGFEDDDDDDEEDGPRRKRARGGEGLRERYGRDADVQSDSSGNEWVTGQVDEEDDSDIDSDDAFGASDDEKFSAYTFRGSSSSKNVKRRQPAPQGGLLDEDGFEGFGDDDEEMDSGEESDNFKENAVDLVAAFDQNYDDSESEEESRSKKSSKRTSRTTSTHDDGSESELDKQSDFTVESEDEFVKEQQSNLLNDLVAGFDTGDKTQERENRARSRAQEAMDPSTAPATSTLDLLAELDPSLKALQGPAVKASKRSSQGIPGAVQVPLAQRQQGRLDRAVASDKAKETLNRWVDTVKHNRRAEHLIFPLPNPDEASAKNTDRLQPLIDSKPFNELEATIQNILLESGMAPTTAKPDDEQELPLEGAGEKQFTVAEVKARNAELRRIRENLFREEIKARRIKKIKSKSYRRVHRKQRERDLAKLQEANAEEGILPAEDDQERLDRLRAEERMGAKHRDSKWAKAMKASGRTTWDEDARAGVHEMAQREEELKRRIHGLPIQDGDVSAEDSDADSEMSDSEANARLQNEVFRLRDEPDPTGKGGKLASMKFMQKAEAARKEQNDAALAQIQRELDGRESSSEDDNAERGRQKFGPQRDLNIALPAQKQNRNEFEERDDSDAEDSSADQQQQKVHEDSDGDDVQVVTNGTATSTRHGVQHAGRSQPRNANSNASQEKVNGAAGGAAKASDVSVNPWGLGASKRKSKKALTAAEFETDDFEAASLPPMLSAPAKAQAKTKKAVSKPIRLLPSRKADDNDTSSSGESDDETPTLSTQRGMIQNAFAGDEVANDFEEEKQLIEREERSSSPAADILPGWGSWAGTGLTKKDKRERKKRNERLQKAAKDAYAAAKGGKKIDQTRRDAKLPGVIISEKRVPKSAKYLATMLPHPFETKAQYERSLRMPVGPEWTTKETHQASTKPRVIVSGGVIRPMEKPLL